MPLSIRLLWVLLLACCPALPGAAASPMEGEQLERLRMPYDGHPMATLLEPTLDARYVPVGVDTEAAVRRAVADGTLREVTYPSLQLAGDWAYVWLGQFARSELRTESSLTRCEDADGFHLLLESNDCTARQAGRLTFQRQADGGLLCQECGQWNLPGRWQRQDAPQCTLPAWDAAAAGRQYAAWWKQFEHDSRSLLVNTSEADWRQRGHLLRPSVLMQSRAAPTLFTLGTAPEEIAAATGIADAGRGALLPRLLALLRTAQVSGRGGLYPEDKPELAVSCAEVWYLRLPAQPGVVAGPVPAADTLVRDAAPFITVALNGDRILLAGLSRELLQLLLALPAEQ